MKRENMMCEIWPHYLCRAWCSASVTADKFISVIFDGFKYGDFEG